MDQLSVHDLHSVYAVTLQVIVELCVWLGLPPWQQLLHPHGSFHWFGYSSSRDIGSPVTVPDVEHLSPAARPDAHLVSNSSYDLLPTLQPLLLCSVCWKRIFPRRSGAHLVDDRPEPLEQNSKGMLRWLGIFGLKDY